MRSAEDGTGDILAQSVDVLLKGPNPDQGTSLSASDFWKRGVEALTEIEDSLKRLSDKRTQLVMTGQNIQGGEGEALQAQHQLTLARLRAW